MQTTTLTNMQTAGAYRLYDDNAEHNLILPLEISSLLAQTKGNIGKAYRAFPWLVIKGMSWFLFILLAILIDYQMLFNLRSLTAIDPNTGLIAAGRWSEIAAIALQGVVAVAAFKFALTTPRRIFWTSMMLGIMTILFGLALVIVAATGDLPRYLQIVQTLFQSSASWDVVKQTVSTGMPALKSAYILSFYMTYLPFLILPLLSGLMAHFAGNHFEKAADIRSTKVTFDKGFREVQSLKAEAEEAIWQEESLRTDFKVNMLLPVQTEIDDNLEQVKSLNMEITAQENYQHNKVSRLFSKFLGQNLIRGAEGTVGENALRNPERAKEIVQGAREVLNDDYDAKAFEKWSNTTGITELK